MKIKYRMDLAKLKKLTTATLVILTLFNCENQEQEKCSVNQEQKNDWTEDGLKGKVKTLTQFTYQAIYRFGKIEKGEPSASPLAENFQMIYNEKGNKIEENRLNSDGSLSENYISKYDENGNKIEENYYDADENSSWKDIYTYDEKGNKIAEYTYDSDSILVSNNTYKYNKNGKIKREFHYWEGRLSTESTFKYNENGKIERISYYVEGNLQIKWTYKYDEKGILIEEIMDDSSRKLFYKIFYRYDEKGNLIEEIIYDSPRKFLKKYTYKEKNTYQYEYDEQKNWTKKIEFQNDIPKTFTEREYQYYE